MMKSSTRSISSITEYERNSKILVFTQFADTAHYLEEQLSARFHLRDVEAVTAETENPADAVCRFSPISNQYEMRTR